MVKYINAFIWQLYITIYYVIMSNNSLFIMNKTSNLNQTTDNISQYEERITQLLVQFKDLIDDWLIEHKVDSKKFSTNFVAIKTKAHIIPLHIQRIKWVYSIVKCDNTYIGLSILDQKWRPTQQLSIVIDEDVKIVEKYIKYSNFSKLLREHMFAISNSSEIVNTVKRDSKFMRIWLMVALKLIIDNPQYRFIIATWADKKRRKIYKYLERFWFEQSFIHEYWEKTLLCMINTKSKNNIQKNLGK